MAEGVPGFDDPELLQPRRLYERQGRHAEYEETVRRLKQERVEELSSYPSLSADILNAVR